MEPRKNIKDSECFDVKTHYSFGENWANYAQHLDQEHINQAVSNLSRLISSDKIKGKRFLDIGCGSGLHSLAAIKMGAGSLTAVDFDLDSVSTTRSVLERHAPEKSHYTVHHANILAPERTPELLLKNSYDIVYSWGVLHHTGDQWTAIRNAASFVAPGGVFIIAIYKKTPLCSFWKIEKKTYTLMPKWMRPVFDILFATILVLAHTLSGKNPIRYIQNYRQERGMRFMNDIADWLGGYPYESASPAELQNFCEGLGFHLEQSFNTQKCSLFGLFGSGCAEYRFRAPV